MKKYLLLLALVCLLGNWALAQTKSTSSSMIIEVKETIDFTGIQCTNGDWPDAYIDWVDNNIPSITGNGTNGYNLKRVFTNNYPISVRNGGNEDYWRLYKGSHGKTYLQKHNSNDDYFYISGLKTDDEVTIWGDNGNGGGFRVTSGNTNHNGENITFDQNNQQASQTIKMQAEGQLELYFYGQWSGILKIEIKTQKIQKSTFDYDPGYEEYDIYDGNSSTTYSLGDDAGFKLNDQDAEYMDLENYKITANNRIAVNSEDWTFNFGMIPPGNWGDNSYSYFSICNLREGDRVVMSYIGEEGPIFASGLDAETGEFYYNGSAAFKDVDNDGVFNNGDKYIDAGEETTVDWHRDEGWIAQVTGIPTPDLKYINTYVVTQDGHLDFAFKNTQYCRIVKIKIYSDHQAMMVDSYEDGSYKAYFNITGELQAKEHIMPGGLEVHVGNDVSSQHAIVVSSKDGPVSYVNAVDGFKLPGVSKDGNNLSINFNLDSSLPTTGTFYRLVPEANGKMKIKFEAKSMNYYRWDIPGNSAYYNNDNANGGDWTVLMDRPNEQTLNVTCPYYLVTIPKEGNPTYQKIADILNGKDYTTATIDVSVDNTYYLYGGWNSPDGRKPFYKQSYLGAVPDPSVNANANNYNNIEFKPFDTEQYFACGVAELLWVEFKPNNKIYPLAKWVPNNTTAVNDINPKNSTKHGVPNPDTYQMEYELADVVGFTDYDDDDIIVKKMSGNITGCRPYIVRDTQDQTKGKLMIDQITFDGTKNPGGTILIKIGDPNKRTDPLYALTIAYSTDPKYDNENTIDHRGHVWDFYTNSLNGLKWTNGTENGAEPEEMGTYFNNYYGQSITSYSSAADVQAGLPKNENSFLYDEVTNHGDWIFNYNLVYDGKLYDPVFTNKYDMEGDNADMIWETEGTVFQTSANQSCIFNEYGKEVEHIASETVDPNRYVGILKGGKFRIPWLRKDDRVIIWMGSGTGRTEDFVNFKITNARDALYNPIYCEYDSENDVWNYDEYKVGGSQWNGKDGDPNYGGCYHFFATGWPNDPSKPADMIFEMTGGELCKIYKIQIYRGDRIITNEIVGKTEEDNKYFLWSRTYDPNDSSDKAVEGAEGYTAEGYTDTHNYNWALKYLGKDQQLANGTGKNSQENEIIAQTGKYSGTPALTNNRVDPEDNTSKVESFTYKHQLGEIGTFRMRGKDMEKNMNYVADYADHNVTIAYQETQPYPYTWDFTDVIGIADNVTNYFSPEEQLGEGTTAPAGSGLTDAVWQSLDDTSYQKTARDLSLWEVDGTSGNYFLRLNSQTSQTRQNPMERDNIFESAKEIGGNQVWANKTIVPEMQGLWFYTEDYDQETGKSYDNLQSNGEWIIKKADANNVGGLEVTTGNCPWFNKIVIPNVPANAAVYLRMKKLSSSQYEAKVRYMFGQQESMSEISTTSETSTSKTFYGIGNDDYILAIMNTNDSKSNLTLSLYGYRIQKLAVSEDPKTVNIKGYASESRNRVIDHTLTSFFTGKPIKAYLAKEKDENTISLVEIKKPMPAATDDGEFVGSVLYNSDNNNDTGEIKVLDGGFHLFVPDMNDYHGDPSDTENMVTNDLQSTIGNMMQSFNAGGTSSKKLSQTAAKDIYVLSYKYLEHDRAGQDTNIGQFEAFYRLATSGANVKPNSAYIQLGVASTSQAKMSIVFEDELFGNQGITTSIDDAVEENVVNGKAEWYSLDGRKLNGVPTAKGLYIVNGKKVLVK